MLLRAGNERSGARASTVPDNRTVDGLPPFEAQGHDRSQPATIASDITNAKRKAGENSSCSELPIVTRTVCPALRAALMLVKECPTNPDRVRDLPAACNVRTPPRNVYRLCAAHSERRN